MGRTWTVPFNLDELNAAFATLDDDAEVAAFARGLHRGVNLGKLKEDAPGAMVSGYDFGLSCRLKAEEFREKQKRGGITSAANRVTKFGTAQPPRSHFEPDLEVTSNLSSNQNLPPVPSPSSPSDLYQEVPGRIGGPVPLPDDVPFVESA